MRAPTEAEIDAAETRLGRKFHPEYRAFLRGGGDVAGARFEPAVVLPCAWAPKLTGLRLGSWERSWFRSPCAYLRFCLRQGGWASLFSLAAS